MEVLDLLLNYVPELFLGGGAYLKSRYDKNKEIKKAFDIDIESLINNYRIERGLEPYNQLELTSKDDSIS